MTVTGAEQESDSQRINNALVDALHLVNQDHLRFIRARFHEKRPPLLDQLAISRDLVVDNRPNDLEFWEHVEAGLALKPHRNRFFKRNEAQQYQQDINQRYGESVFYLALGEHTGEFSLGLLQRADVTKSPEELLTETQEAFQTGDNILALMKRQAYLATTDVSDRKEGYIAENIRQVINQLPSTDQTYFQVMR